MNRSKKKGFTLAETMVAIAVLAIAMSGVLAALAYDVTTSEQTGVMTFANSYNRKVIDLIQSNQVDVTAVAKEATAPADTNAALDNDNWKLLDDGLLASGGGVANFWGAPGSVEFRRWEQEKQRYNVNLVRRRLTPISETNVNLRFQNLLVEVTATTRWSTRQGFRFVRLRGYVNTSQETP